MVSPPASGWNVAEVTAWRDGLAGEIWSGHGGNVKPGT
jgi:hypothetical protein